MKLTAGDRPGCTSRHQRRSVGSYRNWARPSNPTPAQFLSRTTPRPTFALKPWHTIPPINQKRLDMEAMTRPQERGGILLGPGRALEDRRQQRTPIKVLRHPLPAPSWVRPSPRLLHCSSRPTATRGRRAPRPGPAPTPPAPPEQLGLAPASRRRARGAEPGRPPAPASSARFLPRCAEARGQTLRRWALGRAEPAAAPAPAGPRAGPAHSGLSSQSGAGAARAAGKPTPPKAARAGGRRRGSHAR